MDDYSIPPVSDSGTASTLPHLVSSILGASAAVIDIVNATVEDLDGNGDLLRRVFNSTPRPPMDQPWSISLAFLFIAISIIIVGVAGNAFVVAVIFTDRKLLHSSVNLFLLNLALADMGNLIFCTPDAVLAVLDIQWVLPEAMCPLLRFLQQYFLFASVLLQMSIGIERFMAICSPLQMQRFSRRTTVFFLFCAWMLAALFAMPSVIYQRRRVMYGNLFCGNLPDPLYPKQIKEVVEVIWFAIVYCIPLVLLTVLYFIMCRRLWGKECMIAGESQQMAILRLRRSVVKMLVISMLIYFICYTPVQSLGVLHWRPPFIWLRKSMNLLVLVSSAANPIVYIMCCRHFHQRFVSMVNRAIHCCPRSPEKYQTVITDADKIDSAPEVDALGDTTVVVTDYGRALGRGKGGTTPASSRRSADSSSPSPSLRYARASTVSATSFNWGSRDSSQFRPHFRCTNPKKSTEMMTVD